MAHKQPQEPILAVDQIQGNVLPGFNKDFQHLLFLKIVDVPSFKRWLGTLSITNTAKVLRFRDDLELAKARQEATPKATWLNIAFSHSALRLLEVPQHENFEDEAFKQGLWRRSKDLGDPSNVKSEGYQKNWLVGGEKNEAHLVVIIASDDSTDLATEVERVKKTVTTPGSGVEKIFEQSGEVLPDSLAGHEHFGFRDGVSQPGVRGLKRKPGQSLWPGEFVFGYYGQDAKKKVEEPGDTVVNAGTGLEEWAKNGSFLVFRRLKQHAGAFHKFLHDTAQQLNVNVNLLGTKCVGRWPSGVSILQASDSDNPGLAAAAINNPNLLNAFEFPGDDPKGLTCPFAGHIRKTNPRSDVKDAEATLPSAQQTLNESITQTHRLLRRGIPYGAPLAFHIR